MMFFLVPFFGDNNGWWIMMLLWSHDKEENMFLWSSLVHSVSNRPKKSHYLFFKIDFFFFFWRDNRIFYARLFDTLKALTYLLGDHVSVSLSSSSAGFLSSSSILISLPKHFHTITILGERIFFFEKWILKKKITSSIYSNWFVIRHHLCHVQLYVHY